MEDTWTACKGIKTNTTHNNSDDTKLTVLCTDNCGGDKRKERWRREAEREREDKNTKELHASGGNKGQASARKIDD